MGNARCKWLSTQTLCIQPNSHIYNDEKGSSNASGLKMRSCYSASNLQVASDSSWDPMLAEFKELRCVTVTHNQVDDTSWNSCTWFQGLFCCLSLVSPCLFSKSKSELFKTKHAKSLAIFWDADKQPSPWCFYACSMEGRVHKKMCA